MKIIQPSVELIDDINPADIYKKIERCGRVSHQSESKGEPEDFIRKIIKLEHESVLEHVSLTFHIICDRAIMAELTRHRLCSFTIESTRYVKYDELTFIDLQFWQLVREAQKAMDTPQGKLLEEVYQYCIENGCTPEEARAALPCCLKVKDPKPPCNLNELRYLAPYIALNNLGKYTELTYQFLLDNGCTPEEARAVLPLCLKSELYMTANLRELRHILKLRTDKAAHPQMRFIAGQILQILRDKLPVIVEDIQP